MAVLWGGFECVGGFGFRWEWVGPVLMYGRMGGGILMGFVANGVLVGWFYTITSSPSRPWPSLSPSRNPLRRPISEAVPLSNLSALHLSHAHGPSPLLPPRADHTTTTTSAKPRRLSLFSLHAQNSSHSQDETGVYKNLLQETAHRPGLNLPVYTTVRSGPGHLPVFTCTVELAGRSFTGEPAKTKKQAEKNAAMYEKYGMCSSPGSSNGENNISLHNKDSSLSIRLESSTP
ncbi:hypothetical protein MRB53_013414 [Persea americana]|uniref:Uncharacterized protein n=1 Tax=Persea americana TaxID=3435 RepID=A0ACC2K7W1_PERAE|nr:hypothetical protein MRB53_013414 [Persea americana]